MDVVHCPHTIICQLPFRRWTREVPPVRFGPRHVPWHFDKLCNNACLLWWYKPRKFIVQNTSVTLRTIINLSKTQLILIINKSDELKINYERVRH